MSSFHEKAEEIHKETSATSQHQPKFATDASRKQVPPSVKLFHGETNHSLLYHTRIHPDRLNNTIKERQVGQTTETAGWATIAHEGEAMTVCRLRKCPAGALGLRLLSVGGNHTTLSLLRSIQYSNRVTKTTDQTKYLPM
jgi:hypothetical protein